MAMDTSHYDCQTLVRWCSCFKKINRTEGCIHNSEGFESVPSLVQCVQCCVSLASTRQLLKSQQRCWLSGQESA